MQAVRVTHLDGPAGVRVLEVPPPVRQPDEVLVEVKAVAPAFPDLLMSRGQYQITPDLPFSPGSDFAGVVTQSAPGSEFSPGARVAGCLSFGAAAQQVAVSEDRLYPLPADLGFGEAAALPMNYLTAHFALATRAALQAGENVLVLGASGGVGLAAIQVAAGLGAQVIAVVSSRQRGNVALQAGARHAVLREDFMAEARDLTSGHGVDVVVDVVGGDIRNALRTLAPLGRLLAVGFASGEIPTVKVNRLLLTNTDIRGVESSFLWTAGISRRAWDNVMRLRESGYIKPIVHLGGDLTDYAAALQNLERRNLVGRTVLTV